MSATADLRSAVATLIRTLDALDLRLDGLVIGHPAGEEEAKQRFAHYAIGQTDLAFSWFSVNGVKYLGVDIGFTGAKRK